MAFFHKIVLAFLLLVGIVVAGHAAGESPKALSMGAKGPAHLRQDSYFVTGDSYYRKYS